MKTKNLFPLALIGAMILSGATSHASSTNIAAESETLAAQVNITRDTIGQLLAKMKNSQGTTANFSHPDYVTKSRELNARIEKAMIEFESTVANDVFRPASLWVDRLNGINASPYYDKIQKDALLQAQYQQARTAFSALSSKYQTAIQNLYQTVLPKVDASMVSYDATNVYCGNIALNVDITRWHAKSCLEKLIINLRLTSSDPRAGFTSFDYTIGHNVRWPSQYSNPEEIAKRSVTSFYTTDPAILPEARVLFYASVVEKDCMTASCTALYSSQLASFITLVSTSLDQPIRFKTPLPGTILTLAPREFYIERALELLKDSTGRSNSLPFDISDTQYRQAMVEKIARSYAGNEGSESKSCTSEADRMKALACYSELGCLTAEEKNFVESAIQAGSGWGNSKSQRVACLRN